MTTDRFGEHETSDIEDRLWLLEETLSELSDELSKRFESLDLLLERLERVLTPRRVPTATPEPATPEPLVPVPNPSAD